MQSPQEPAPTRSAPSGSWSVRYAGSLPAGVLTAERLRTPVSSAFDRKIIAASRSRFSCIGQMFSHG